jgi:ribonuclease E
MLIDAAHAEETRVAVVDGTHVDEFDFESRAVKQLRGNIYLAKVTRVEPSLQAAFIEYGGNRHGFLAFNEIHPDYFQIPVADREKLLREVETDEDHPDDALEDEDADDEAAAAAERRKRRLLRRYKIQDVIKRRQIMLVQVVKEERGNKGAALTTYLSLAGRYCVLMPNTARGGGISRKITAVTDRKRLKSAAASLDVPEGMGLIIRTAGAKRTKAEIKRDYEYLIRLWENIRETTLNSIAPALIYEEEDLVKRAIRDMYDKELDGICVEGEQGYRDAKEFMRVLMPSQAKKVTPYRDPTPLFVHYKVEDQLALIHSPVVPLRSGGYLVINQTEALVAVDVNSGKSTRERNVEATALKTNLEAAEEAARQLRLRDLAGPDRHRLHRHGRVEEQPGRREGAEGRAGPGSRPHPDGQDQRLRPDGDQPPAPSLRPAGRHHPHLPALRGPGPRPLDRVERAPGAPRLADRGGQGRRRRPDAAGQHDRRPVHP